MGNDAADRKLEETRRPRERIEAQSKEQVNHPAHYGGEDNPYECIKVMEAWDAVATYFFCQWSAVKYLPRAGKKDANDPTTDLQKASWYSNRAAEVYDRLPPHVKDWLSVRPF